MTVKWIEIMLRAWRSEGENVSAGDFRLLEIDDHASVINAIHYGIRKGETSRIVFLHMNLHQFDDHTEPNEVFALELASALEAIADWLDQRPKGTIKALQESGAKVDILIEAWIDSDQFDLSLPASFLLACGKQNIPVVVTTND